MLLTKTAGGEFAQNGVGGGSGGLCGRKEGGPSVVPMAVEREDECSRAAVVAERRGGNAATAAAAAAEGDDDGEDVPPALPFSLLRTRPFFSSNNLASPSGSPACPGRAPTVAAATPSPTLVAQQQQQQQQQGHGVRWFAGLSCLQSGRGDRGNEAEEEAEEVDGMSVLAARGAGRPELRLSSPSQASMLGSFYGCTGKGV